MEISVDQVAMMLMGISEEQLPILGLPFWYLLNLVDQPANHCLDAALTLQSAYATFGIESVPAPVELFCKNEVGETTAYGSPDPRFENGLVVGHAGLFLPQSQRFVDPTVQQFPELRRKNPAPVFLPLQRDWSEVVGQGVGAICGKTGILYRPLPLSALNPLIDHLQRITNNGHYRAGVNLATHFLQALSLQPETRQRALTGPHPELARLMRQVDGATFSVDDEENLRVQLSGGSGSGHLLDEFAA